MAPRLDDYVLRMRNLHQRYNLSKNMLELFRAYGEHHRGTKSPEELGRWLRTSPLLRRACTDTISSLAIAMQKNPTHECIAECGDIITCCTEMLNLANESKQGTILPFMKFPAEIRRNIYRYYFNDLFLASRWKQPGNIILKRPHNCHCAPHQSYIHGLVRPLQMSLVSTCSQIKNEALAMWFADNVFHFACGCELKHSLQINTSLRHNLKKVKVHWTGQESAAAFNLLQGVPSLKRVVVVISKSTTNNMSEKEALLRTYFTPRCQTRITEALGFDELMEFRGLERIEVEHVDRSQAHRRAEEERNGLQKILESVAQGS